MENVRSKPIWHVGKNMKRGQNWYNPVLILLFFFLVIIGLTNLYSAVSDDTQFFYAQLKHASIGILLFFLCGWVIPVRYYNYYSYWLFIGISLSLLIVLGLGHTAGGSQRWIMLGPLRFQPSELAKVITAIIVAKWFSSHGQTHPYRLRDVWPVLSLVGLIFALIFLQPDLGTGGICLIIAAIQMSFIRFNIRTIINLGTVGILGGFIGWNFFLLPYQRLRIENLLNPDLDPSGSGYNSLQSLIAIGSGQLFGKGYLQGTQTQLQFLPARHTDFIFSVFAEENGFWGGAIIFAIFSIIAYIGLEIGKRSKDTFNLLFAVGLAAFIFVEFALNIAMVLGLFPVVGMPLPFFSYGGSSMISLCASIGLLVALERDVQKKVR